MRNAMRASDPKRLVEGAGGLDSQDAAERSHFVFYQDDGGLRATDETNTPLDTIYYLGVIDILTPYSTKKKFEHIWKGLKDDRVGVFPQWPTCVDNI
jgi:1-phosphatidylinositol-4-phosphate 5-kinase